MAMRQDSTRTSDRMRPSLNPSVLRMASSLVRSRIACAMVLADTSRIVNSTAPAMAIMMLPMSPICLAKPDDERLLGRGLGLVRRVREHCVELLRDRLGLSRILQLDHVPADLIVAVVLVPDRLVHVVVVEEELRLVDALLGRVVDAVDGELPRAAVRRAVDDALQRDAVPDLPPEAARGVDADDGAGAVGEPGLLLVLGHLEFRIDPQPALRIHRHVGEEILRILVDAAEPVGVAQVGDALGARDALLVRAAGSG